MRDLKALVFLRVYKKFVVSDVFPVSVSVFEVWKFGRRSQAGFFCLPGYD